MLQSVCLLVLIPDFEKDYTNINEYKCIVVERLKENRKIGLPGGKVEDKEYIFDALKREIKEEMNIDIKKEWLIPILSTFVNGTYCTTFAVKIDYLHLLNLNNMQQQETFIVPKIINFKDFEKNNAFPEYNSIIKLNAKHFVPYLFDDPEWFKTDSHNIKVKDDSLDDYTQDELISFVKHI